jgi:hypothetical protein
MPPDANPEAILRVIAAVALRAMPSLAERRLVSWDVTVLRSN